jgi:hypothetical protein
MSRLPFKSFDRGEDGEPPTIESGGGHGPYTYDTPLRIIFKSQIPCPSSDSLGCMGTDPPDQERKPENDLKRHTTKGCGRRCICQYHLAMDQAASEHHRRTEKCPNWTALSKEIRRSLLNPGFEPSPPEVISGTKSEHNSVLTPCEAKLCDGGLESCRIVMADLDAKTERLQSLEHELEASNQQTSQTQQRCDDKIAKLENIIETLLERLRDKNVDIPSSLQKRLARECPACIVPCTPRIVVAQPCDGTALRRPT